MGLTLDAVQQEARRLARSQYAPVTAQQVEQWEKGLSLPDLEHLETLAEIYRCPVGHFFSGFPAGGAGGLAAQFGPLSFRGLAEGKPQGLSPTTRQSLAQFVELADWFGGAIKESGVAWEVRVRPLQQRPADIASLAGQQARRLGFSESVRQEWHSADDALEWWRRRIQDLGVFCFQLKLEPKDVRGAALWLDGHVPFILINHQDGEAATGRLFTLLHEYCHLLLPHGVPGVACDFRGVSGRGAVEPVANRFAARVLAPLELVRRHLREQGLERFKESWSDAELDRLRKPLFVSRDVIAISLEELGLAPAGLYRQKQSQWERRFGGRRAWGRGRNPTKKERKARQLGSSAFRLLATLDERGMLPRLETAYLLDTRVEKVAEFIQWSRENLLGQ
jgi:Zn-dependent peptidase ImmA (M78 family)